MSDESEQRRIAREGWRKLLDPILLQENLMRASLFLLAFEILNTSIIDQIHSFYNLGLKDGEPDCPEYVDEVLTLGKGKLSSSIKWLVDRGIINQSDLEAIEAIRKHRNEIAHELPKFVAESTAIISESLFLETFKLVTKIDRWWIIEFEVPANPEYDGKKVTPEEVSSGNMIFLQMLVQIALGKNEEERGAYHKEMLRIWEQKREADPPE